MQSILDNLCRCFGTTPTMPSSGASPGTSAAPGYEACTSGTEGSPSSQSASTPDMKRRTRSLALQDKQWDNLFSQQPKLRQNVKAFAVSPGSEDMEHAVALANAKLSAARPRTKRKRSRNSREDIFRSKKAASVRGTPNQPQHPINRFLSNYPVVANSLCFATPVRDSREDNEPNEVDLPDQSVISDTNTHQTADDTVSSTVYYENTKLAGLQQKTPPMPLFDSFQVSDGTEIHRIVATKSHSSQRMVGYNRCPEIQEWNETMLEMSDEEEEEEEEEAKDFEDEVPQMVHSSSDSTRSSQRLL